MNKIPQRNLVEVRAYNECSDLLQNGYICLFISKTHVGWVAKFRHRSNGRTLMVETFPGHFCIKENKSIIKKQEV